MPSDAALLPVVHMSQAPGNAVSLLDLRDRSVVVLGGTKGIGAACAAAFAALGANVAQVADVDGGK